MKFHQLEYLVAVADQGSVRGAAQALRISPAAVSRGLIELEESLGSALLLRQSQGVTLTEAGQSLLKNARQILRQLEETTQWIEQQRQEENLTLSVGLTPWVLEALGSGAVRRFRHARPTVRLYMTAVFGTAHVGLREGTIDLAIGMSAPDASELRVQELFKCDWTLVCRKGHPLAEARSVSELADASWITAHPPEEMKPPLRELFMAAAADPTRARVHYSAGSPGIFMAVTEKTDLLAVSPWPLLEATDMRDRLHAMQVKEMMGHVMVTSALTRRNSAPNPLAKLFLRCLLDTWNEVAESTEPRMKRLFSTVEEIYRPGSPEEMP